MQLDRRTVRIARLEERKAAGRERNLADRSARLRRGVADVLFGVVLRRFDLLDRQIAHALVALNQILQINILFVRLPTCGFARLGRKGIDDDADALADVVLSDRKRVNIGLCEVIAYDFNLLVIGYVEFQVFNSVGKRFFCPPAV